MHTPEIGRARTLRYAPAGLLAMALAVAPLAAARAADATPPTRNDAAAEKIGWRLGTQAYTFRSLTLFETIDKAKALGLKYIELYPNQRLRPDGPATSSINMSAADREALKAKLKEAGITPVNFGVVGLPSDEAGARRVFDFAKEMGIETIVAEPSENSLEMIDKLCNEYQINVALHNHPKPSHYWDAETVLTAIKGRSKRIGACADTGHWMRSGLDPLECLKKLEGHIIEFHFKDLNETGVRAAHDVPWGTGVGNTKALLAEIRRQGFKGVFSIEYEKNDAELTDNVAKCIAYFDQQAGELEKVQPATK